MFHRHPLPTHLYTYYIVTENKIFASVFSPVTKRKFVLSQYIGGIQRNSTNHIVKAEALSMSYGVKFSPVLNEGAGQLVGF